MIANDQVEVIVSPAAANEISTAAATYAEQDVIFTLKQEAEDQFGGRPRCFSLRRTERI